MAGGIVWVDDNGGAGAGSDGAFERREIELPAVVVDEGVADQFDVIEIGEEIEERVTGAGDENFIAGIAEKAEEVRVGFAGAGGEEEVAWCDVSANRTIVGSDGFASGGEALGGGFVANGGSGLQRCKNRGFVIGKAAFGGIGNREIQEGVATAAVLGEGQSEAVFGEVPIGARGKHEESIVQEMRPEVQRGKLNSEPARRTLR